MHRQWGRDCTGKWTLCLCTIRRVPPFCPTLLAAFTQRSLFLLGPLLTFEQTMAHAEKTFEVCACLCIEVLRGH